MVHIDQLLALSAEVQSLRLALVRKEAEFLALAARAGRGEIRKAGSHAAKSASRRPANVASGSRDGKAEGATLMATILAVLARSKADSMSAAEVAALAGAKTTSVSTLLHRLVTRGQIKKVSKGQYAAL